MGLLFLPVRLLDGWDRTRENAAGALPAIFSAAGLEKVELTGRLRTAFGTLALQRAELPR